MISATGPSYIVTANANLTLNSLTLNSPNVQLTLSQQTAATYTFLNGLSIQSGTAFLSGGTITNSNITIASAGLLNVRAPAILSNISLSDTSPQSGTPKQGMLSASGTLLLQNNCTFNNASLAIDGTVTGSAVVALDKSSPLSGSGQILIYGPASPSDQRPPPASPHPRLPFALRSMPTTSISGPISPTGNTNTPPLTMA